MMHFGVELLMALKVRFVLQSGEDVFLFDDDVVFVVDFDIGSRVVLVNDFVAFLDGFDIGADRFDDGIGRGFFGFTE